MSLNSVLRQAAMSPTPSLAKSIELDVKLQQRVCQIAGLRLEDLPSDSKTWLEHAVHDWVADRSVSDTKMKVAASVLRRRKGVNHSKGGQQQRVKSSTPPPPLAGGAHQDPPRSHTTEPSLTALRAEVERIQFGGGGSPKAAMVGPLRPEVLRRMQRLNADREFSEALAKEQADDEAKRAQQMAARHKQFSSVKEEMARAEKLRLERLKQQEDARLRAHSEIEAQLAEARAEEHDRKVLRAERVAHERHLLQQQLEEKHQAKRLAKYRDEQENEALRRYQEEKEASDMMKEIEKAVVQREGLLEAQRLDQARAAVANAKKKLPKDPVTVLDTRAFHTEKSAEMIRKRTQLQELAASQYAEEQRRLEEARRHLEERERESVARREAVVQQRKEQEERERLRKREDLVSSLETEIAVAKTKKKIEQEQKVALRREGEKEAEVERRRQQEKHALVKEEQRRRREKMEEDLNDRITLKLQPSPIKIGS